MNSVSSEDVCLRNSIKFLHDVADVIPPGFPVLKSFCSSKSRILELRCNMYLPSKITGTTVQCPRCCIKFSEGPARCRVKSEQKLTRFTRKILKKQLRGEVLTNFQLKCLKHSKNLHHNTIVTECRFCKKEVCTLIPKPNHVEEVIIVEEKSVKKKRKKDKFCGLQEEAVLQATPKTINPAKPFITQDFISLSTSPKTNIKITKSNRRKTGKRESAKANNPTKPINNRINEIKKSKHKIQKLNNFLNKKVSAKNSSSKLKQFLQGL